MEQARLELATLEDESLREQLQTALALRAEREQTLADARNLHEDQGQRLRLSDEERLACEQRLGPLRERIGDLRLKEQAARLNFEQFSQQLARGGRRRGRHRGAASRRACARTRCRPRSAA